MLGLGPRTIPSTGVRPECWTVEQELLDWFWMRCYAPGRQLPQVQWDEEFDMLDCWITTLGGGAGTGHTKSLVIRTCTCSQPYFHSEDTHALTHVCTHARMHAHARTHAYIHMHTHTHIHTTYWQILVLSSAFLVSLLITNICQHLQVLWALKWPHYGHLKHLYTWMGCIPQAITSDTAQTCIIDVQTVAHCLYISVVLVWLQKFSFSYSFF